MADRDSPIEAAHSAPPPGDSPARHARALGTPLASVIAVIATLLGLIVLAWTVLFVTKGRFLKHTFEKVVAAQTHRDVKVAGDFQLYFAPFNVRFLAEGLTVSNPEWAGRGNFFSAKRIDTRISTWSLFSHKYRFNWVGLEDGHVDLQWDKAGKRNTWTFSEKKQGDPFELPAIRRALVQGTLIRYVDPRMQIEAGIRVHTVEATDTRLDNAVRFDGNGTARGTRFTMNGALLSPNATVSGGENKLQLHVEGVRTAIDVSGTLPGATEIEGADLHIDARGQNLADVFAVAGIAVPDTRSYRLRSAMTKRGDEWRFTGMRGRFGDSDLSGKFTVALKEPRLLLTADLATRVLDIVDAGPFIGYSPQQSEAGAVVTQAAGTPRILPDAPLRVEALKNFDAKVNWTVRTVRAESLPVSNITLGLDLDNRLLKLSPLNFSLARGTVNSDITINARREPVFTDYDIRLSPTPMGVLLAGFGVEESGTTGTLKARVQMTGSGNSVRDSLANSNGRIAVILPKGSFWTRNVQLSELDIGTFVQKMFEKKLKEPVQINCGLIGFTVRNGIAAADPILIDTEKNVMLGRGGFSFKNETIDMAFRADSKKFSLFAGQSPVGIGGYFARPSIDVISPELLGRAGAGLGLGIVASPFAAVIAFVDVGDAKAADCGPVLAGASARAQRTDKGKPRDDVGKGTTAKSEDGKRSKEERKQQRKKFLGIF
ncbi:AsmA family protein [Sphingomonas psychrotolerans]|uniref:AsmA family protein n=1 Tax=Sphingomonas psychrotolerans TaxID=1327635 RepID=A0ABU3N7K1_9SPHN|nr:AsmA family protein [Sphingomonas psychrotolerans]MDT8759305.1 AsmA family protein [Sphingomonas psychrotolerans]